MIHFEERCTAKNNFDTNKFTRLIAVLIILLFASSNLFFSSATVEDSTCPRELVQRYAFSLNFFLFFFLARG